MKKSFTMFGLILTLLFLANTLTAFAGDDTRTFNFKDFNAVEIGAGMHLIVTQSDSFSIEATGDNDDLKDLQVEKKGNVLKIKYKSHSFFNFSRHHKVEFNIKMPQLSALDLSGGARGDIKMDNTSKTFSAELSGGAYLEGELKCGNIAFDLSGGSRVNLKGSGGNIKIEGSGGSMFKLKDFSGINANVGLSGGSQATITMNGELNADLNGGSHVYYYGKVELGSTDFSGGSGISKGR